MKGNEKRNTENEIRMTTIRPFFVFRYSSFANADRD